MRDLEVWAAVIGAAVAVIALWWSIVAQTRELRSGRADELRRRLLPAKGAVADAWSLVRDGESLIQIGSGIAAEARDRQAASALNTLSPRSRIRFLRVCGGSSHHAVEILAPDRQRAQIATYGWYRSPRASELRVARADLANVQNSLTGHLRMIAAAAGLFISLLDATHSASSFKALLDRISQHAEELGLKTVDANGFVSLLDDLLSEASFVRFFGEQDISQGTASAEGRSHYAAAYRLDNFVTEAVGCLILLDDKSLTSDSDAREVVTSTHTEEIRHHLEKSRLPEEEKRRLRHLVDLVEEALSDVG